ncbi:hypothetical protein Tco_1520513, partial [Tanacetum coccineum]
PMTEEDASKQGVSIEDIDKDAEVSLVDETQGRSDDTGMFDTDALIGDEVFAKNDMTEKEHDMIPKEVSAAETVTTSGIKILVSIVAPSTTVEQEQGELTIEEKSKLFMELMNERKRHFAKLRAEEKRRKPLTKEVKGSEKKAKSSEKKAEGSKKKSISKKRVGNEQKQESSKRQRMEDDKETDEHKEAEGDDKAEMKKHIEIVQDDKEIAIDAIPLATKPPMIIKYKIVKEE